MPARSQPACVLLGLALLGPASCTTVTEGVDANETASTPRHALPDSTAGCVVRSYLDALNANDGEAFVAWYRDHDPTPHSTEQLLARLDLYTSNYRRYTAVGFSEQGGRAATITLDYDGRLRERLTIELSTDDPPKLVTFHFRRLD